MAKTSSSGCGLSVGDFSGKFLSANGMPCGLSSNKKTTPVIDLGGGWDYGDRF